MRTVDVQDLAHTVANLCRTANTILPPWHQIGQKAS